MTSCLFPPERPVTLGTGPDREIRGSAAWLPAIRSSWDRPVDVNAACEPRSGYGDRRVADHRPAGWASGACRETRIGALTGQAAVPSQADVGHFLSDTQHERYDVPAVELVAGLCHQMTTCAISVAVGIPLAHLTGVRPTCPTRSRSRSDQIRGLAPAGRLDT